MVWINRGRCHLFLHSSRFKIEADVRDFFKFVLIKFFFSKTLNGLALLLNGKSETNGVFK